MGEIRLVTSAWYNNQPSLSYRKLEGDLDWKQWLGSAPERPLDPAALFNWYYFWDYSGGLLVGQAAHIMDCIQWYMNSKDPLAVTAPEPRPGLSGTDVPGTATITIEYPGNYLVVFTLGIARCDTTRSTIKSNISTNRARLDLGRESYALYPQSAAAAATWRRP